MPSACQGKLSTMQRIPRGIYNAGNSCYVNCILQVLSAIPTFTARLENKYVINRTEHHPDEAQLVMELLNLLTEMHISPGCTVSSSCGHERKSLQKARKTSNCKTLINNKPVHAAAFLDVLFSLPGRNRFIRFQQNDARNLLNRILASCRNVSRAAMEAPKMDKFSSDLSVQNIVSCSESDHDVNDTDLPTRFLSTRLNEKKGIPMEHDPKPLRITRNKYRAARARAINTLQRSDIGIPIIDLFRGRAADKRQCCECKLITTAKRETIEYSVPVSIRKKPLRSLKSALESLKRPIVLEGEHMPICALCKTRRKAVLWWEATQLPLVCILHLKVTPKLKKTRKICQTSWHSSRPFVPFTLNIGEHVSNERDIHLMDEYDLNAIVCFQDTTPDQNNGPAVQQAHYFSFVKRTARCGAIQWFRTDDETVERVDLGQVRRVLLMRVDEPVTPYLLFYTSQFLTREEL